MIKLFDNYSIDTNEGNFIIVEEKIKTKKETGKTEAFTTNLGYYSTLKSALNGLMRIVQRKKIAEKDYTLGEAIILFEHIESDFEKLLLKVKENMPV